MITTISLELSHHQNNTHFHVSPKLALFSNRGGWIGFVKISYTESWSGIELPNVDIAIVYSIYYIIYVYIITIAV